MNCISIFHQSEIIECINRMNCDKSMATSSAMFEMLYFFLFFSSSSSSSFFLFFSLIFLAPYTLHLVFSRFSHPIHFVYESHISDLIVLPINQNRHTKEKPIVLEFYLNFFPSSKYNLTKLATMKAFKQLL